MTALRALFAPPGDSLTRVEVQPADLSSYDRLLEKASMTKATQTTPFQVAT